MTSWTMFRMLSYLSPLVGVGGVCGLYISVLCVRYIYKHIPNYSIAETSFGRLVRFIFSGIVGSIPTSATNLWGYGEVIFL